MFFFIKTLFRYAGIKAWTALGLMILLGLTQGVGLAMIIPFLHVIGLASSGSSQYAQLFSRTMAAMGISPGFLSVILAYLVIICIHSFALRFKDILVAKIGAGFAQHMRDRLYMRFCHTDWLGFLSIPNAEIIHVMTGDIKQVAFGTQKMIQVAATCIQVLIYIGFSFTLSLPMTLAVLGCGGIFLVLLYPFNRRAAGFGGALWTARNAMVRIMTEHINGMKVSRSYNLESEQKKSFFHTSQAMTDQMVGFNRLSATTRTWYQVGAAMAIASCLAVGVKGLDLPPVDLMVIIFLFSRILPGFSNIQQSIQRFVNTMPSFRAVLAMEEKLQPSPSRAKGGEPPRTFSLEKEISFEAVWFRYDKTRDNWTLKDISFTLPARRVTAIAGHSGAGKTSIADLILGLLAPDKGLIRVDGNQLSDKDLETWRQGVGYVPQETFLFSESIADNLRKALPGATEPMLWSALEKAAAADFVSTLDHGLDTVVGDNGIRLSGGERQRIALARALLRNPRLLVLDEATSSLDRENQHLIQEALDRLRKQMTIVVIAHRFSTIENADHVVVLDQGQVLRPGIKNKPSR